MELVEKLTKQEMVDFYNVHLNPASTQRAKAAIHLLAQTSPEEIAASSDSQEQTKKLAQTLGQLLSQMGVEADTTKLEERLSKADVAGGDTESITAAMSEYLTKDSGTSSADASQLVTSAESVLGQILPTLGIRPKGMVVQDDNASTTSSEARLPAIKEAEVIVDVRAFKASMPLSEGARPVKDLSEFEDFEPKL